MTDNLISNPSGSIEAIKFGIINKSPVLYLRRSRITDFERPFKDGDREPGFAFTEHTPSDPVFDKHGHKYPNHESKGRLGAVEWVKFRDYKKRISVNWIRKQELIID